MDGNREWETLIECVSATGNRLPAFYIYARTAHHAGWHEEANGLAPDTVFAYTDNGWTKNYIGLSGPEPFRNIRSPSAPGRTNHLHANFALLAIVTHLLVLRLDISLLLLRPHCLRWTKPRSL